jgi:hypothetical protein
MIESLIPILAEQVKRLLPPHSTVEGSYDDAVCRITLTCSVLAPDETDSQQDWCLQPTYTIALDGASACVNAVRERRGTRLVIPDSYDKRIEESLQQWLCDLASVVWEVNLAHLRLT